MKMTLCELRRKIVGHAINLINEGPQGSDTSGLAAYKNQIAECEGRSLFSKDEWIYLKQIGERLESFHKLKQLDDQTPDDCPGHEADADHDWLSQQITVLGDWLNRLPL